MRKFDRSLRVNRLSHILFLSTSVLAIAVSAPVLADDFVVNTPVATTNGGATVDGNDTITVKSGGSITTGGIAVHGIITSGGSNTVTVEKGGQITTQGTSSTGIITLEGNSTIVNNGSIETQDTLSAGIQTLGVGSTAINNGTISTQGSLSDGMKLNEANTTATNNGSISTTGTNSEAIAGNDANQTLTNNGSLSATGADSDGIWVSGANYKVINSGTINVSGTNGHGIFANLVDGVIVNSGSITSGVTSAIESTGTANVTNTGALLATGTNGFGIRTGGGDSVITNAGTVTTTGSGSTGIRSDGLTSQIFNSGTIFSSGPSGRGVVLIGGNSTFENSGSVVVEGPLGAAVATLGGTANIVTNSGKVISNVDSAFQIHRPNDTLNLNAPSFIGGVIDIGTTANNVTLNIQTGLSHSVLWTFDTSDLVGNAPNITGTAPSFWNGATGQFATYDPTGFAGDLDLAVLLAGQVAELDDGLDANDYRVSIFGNQAQFNGNGTSTFDRSATVYGGAATLNRSITDSIFVGGSAGFHSSTLLSSNVYTQDWDNQQTGFFANAHGVFMLDALDIGLDLSGGLNQHSNNRFVNDNLAMTFGETLGISWAQSSYQSWWVAPELSISHTFEPADDLTITPSAHVRYLLAGAGSYTESGANENATVGNRRFGVVEAGGELAAKKELDKFSINGAAGVLTRNVVNDGANVTLVGQTNNISANAGNSRGFYLSGGVDFNLTDMVKVEANARSYWGTDSKNYGATASIKGQF